MARRRQISKWWGRNIKHSDSRLLTLSDARGGKLIDLAQHNRLAIFSYVRRYGPVTTPKVADALGLTPVTVANVIRELESEGWVVASGMAESSGGRRPVLYTVSAERGKIIAVDVAGYQVDVAVVGLSGKIELKERTVLDLERKTPTLAVIESISKMADQVGWDNVIGVGMAVPAIVEPATGTVIYSVPLGWRDVPLGTIVKQTFGWPVVVYNQTHAAVYGEVDVAWNTKFTNILYLQVGLGIGMGVVVGNQVHWGSQGKSGELGHTVVDPDGPECECGNKGCLEPLASVKALVDYARRAGSDVTSDGAGLTTVFERAAEDEGPEREALRKVCRYLGVALINACRLFDPDLVLVSGPPEDHDQVLAAFMQREIDRYTPLVLGGQLTIKNVRLGHNARLIGAATGLLETLFADGMPLRSAGMT